MKKLQTLIAVFIISTTMALAGGGNFEPNENFPPQQQTAIPPHPHDDEETIVIVQDSSGQIWVAIIGALGVIGASVVGFYLNKKKKD